MLLLRTPVLIISTIINEMTSSTWTDAKMSNSLAKRLSTAFPPARPSNSSLLADINSHTHQCHYIFDLATDHEFVNGLVDNFDALLLCVYVCVARNT